MVTNGFPAAIEFAAGRKTIAKSGNVANYLIAANISAAIYMSFAASFAALRSKSGAANSIAAGKVLATISWQAQ